MSALETKEIANGKLMTGEDSSGITVSTGESHQPAQETIDRAEALKVEGNALLEGKQ